MSAGSSSTAPAPPPVSSGEPGSPALSSRLPSYQELARSQARPPVLRRARPTLAEVLGSLSLLLPVPLWALGGGSRGGSELLLVVLVITVVLGVVLRRLPSPVPSVAMLPTGAIWAGAILLLPGGMVDLVTALVVGVLLVLSTALPSPGEISPPAVALAAQAAVPALGGGLALTIAISLLGYSAPLYAVVLVPTLGALALAVHLFTREEGLGGGEERELPLPGAPAGPHPPPSLAHEG